MALAIIIYTVFYVVELVSSTDGILIACLVISRIFATIGTFKRKMFMSSPFSSTFHCIFESCDGIIYQSTLAFQMLQYQISREKFEPEPEFEPWTSSLSLY